jgi:hypothetical protein
MCSKQLHSNTLEHLCKKVANLHLFLLLDTNTNKLKHLSQSSSLCGEFGDHNKTHSTTQPNSTQFNPTNQQGLIQLTRKKTKKKEKSPAAFSFFSLFHSSFLDGFPTSFSSGKGYHLT